jgi:hypothetical protein
LTDRVFSAQRVTSVSVHPQPTLSLREKQSLFARLLAELILWIYSRGWEVTLADGAIDTPRKFRAEDGRKFEAPDAQHMKGSLHYYRLAQDLNLFVADKFISDGGHPVWTEIGVKWESLNPLCAWGGRFNHPDANHVSLRHEGKA